MSGRSTRKRIGYPVQYPWASLADQLVKNPPAMRETWVQSLGWEDPLEKEEATHSSILDWRILWIEDRVGYSPCDCRVGHDCMTNFQLSEVVEQTVDGPIWSSGQKSGSPHWIITSLDVFAQGEL